MPRNSLRNIGAPSAPPSGPVPSAAPGGVAPGAPEPPPVPELPPEVQSLLSERQALEAKMAALTGHAPGGASEANRFPVTPLTQRRAEDAEWARRREGQGEGQPAQEPDIGRQLGALVSPDGPNDRTGQRDLQDPAGRFSEAVPPALRQFGRDPGGALKDRFSSELSRRAGGLRDRFSQGAGTQGRDILGRIGDDLPPPLREIGGPLLKQKKEPELREKRLRNDPEHRSFSPKRPTIPVPQEPMLREIKDRFSGPAKRLETDTGGSGDLDQLRQTAGERMKAKREEERREEREKARRKEQRDERRRDQRRMTKRGKYD